MSVDTPGDGGAAPEPALKTLRDVTSQKVVEAFPELFTEAAEVRARDILKKRGEVVRTAWDVIDRVSADLKKMSKPDRPGSKNADGTVLTPDGYSDDLLKKIRETAARLKAVTDAFNNMAAVAKSGDKAWIDEAFQKLSQASDKASKGAGKSDDDAA